MANVLWYTPTSKTLWTLKLLTHTNTFELIGTFLINTI